MRLTFVFGTDPHLDPDWRARKQETNTDAASFKVRDRIVLARIHRGRKYASMERRLGALRGLCVFTRYKLSFVSSHLDDMYVVELGKRSFQTSRLLFCPSL